MHWTISEILSTLMLVTLVAVLIGDKVLGWLKTRGIDLSKLEDTYDLATKTHTDTQALLKRFDDSKLEIAIESLSTNITVQTELLREMVALNKLNHEEHKLILDQLARIDKR